MSSTSAYLKEKAMRWGFLLLLWEYFSVFLLLMFSLSPFTAAPFVENTAMQRSCLDLMLTVTGFLSAKGMVLSGHVRGGLQNVL